MLLEQFAEWLCSQSPAEPDILLILQRLGIGQMSDLDTATDCAIDRRRHEALLALAMVVCGSASADVRLSHYILRLLRSHQKWQVHHRLNRRKLVADLSHSVLRGIQISHTDKVEAEVVRTFRCLCEALFSEDADIENIAVAVAGMTDSFVESNYGWQPDSLAEMVQIGTAILDSGVFDVRIILADVPKGSRVDELLQRHYGLAGTMVCSLQSLLASHADRATDALRTAVAALYQLALGYYQATVAFVVEADSNEAFLVSLLNSLLELLMACQKYIENSLHVFFKCTATVLLSAHSFRQFSHFVDIAENLCRGLVSAADGQERSTEAILLLRDLVFALTKPDQDLDTHTSVAATTVLGRNIGRLLRGFIGSGNRSFAESFVANMGVGDEAADLSHNTSNGPHDCIVGALGSIAVSVCDDAVSKICLSLLIAQFKKAVAVDGCCCKLFFEQFNLIASSENIAYLNIVLDVYTEHFMKAASLHAVQQIASALENLAKLSKPNQLKTEIMAHSLIRLFVDRGLESIKTPPPSEKSPRKTAHTHPPAAPPRELECLLPAIVAILDELDATDFSNKAALVETFQKFWFVLVSVGYQPQLAWPKHWLPLVKIIASASPVLIKGRDRLQTTSTPFSLALLSQTAHVQLKAHVISLLTSSASQARHINLAQCLWLLSFYYCESFKLETRVQEDLLAYLKNDIVNLLDLYPFVEDITFQIIRHWVAHYAQERTKQLDTLVCLLIDSLCHIFSRVHKAALQYLLHIFDTNQSIFCCRALWQSILRKVRLQYEVSKRHFGEKISNEFEDIDEYIRDPNYARDAFADLVKVARQIFETAMALYPHEFYAFVLKTFTSEGAVPDRPGDRDIRVLELLRICVPNISSPTQYFGLNLDFTHNAEDNLRWQLFKSGFAVSLDSGMSSYDSRLVLELIWSSPHSSERNEQHWLNLLYQTSRDINQDPDPSKLALLVHIPLAVFSSNMVKTGIKCWSWVLENNPSLIGKFISEFVLAWKHHQKNSLGAFRPDTQKHPFQAKMTLTPSRSELLAPQNSVSVPYIILFDFLQEAAMISLKYFPDLLYLYIKLVLTLLDSSLSFRGFPNSRAAWINLLLFALETLHQYRPKIPLHLMLILKSKIFRSLIRLFEMPVEWVIQDVETINFERSLIVQLQDLLDAETKVARYEPDMAFGSPKLQKAPPPSDAKTMRQSYLALLGLFKDLLQHDLERIQVWTGDFKGRSTIAKSIPTWQQHLNTAAKHSPLMAFRLWERFNLSGVKDIFEPRLRDSFLLLGSDELVNFCINNNLAFGSKILAFAPPLFPASALCIFRNANFRSKPMFVNYAMRSLEVVRPDTLYFYIPQIVQTLRHDSLGYIERTIMHIAKASSLFAHQIIWNLKANTFMDDAGTIPDPCKAVFENMIHKVTKVLAGTDRSFFEREFLFFDKVTSISGALKPYVKKEKWEKKKKIDEELQKIQVDPGVYLPSNPESIVLDIDYDSGKPLQSHAKAPFMATFKVRGADKDSKPTWQSAIFKVGDDCRQDVLALQLIAALKNIFERAGLHVYYFPYRVVATAPGCGVIEEIPNSISRDRLGREKINGLYDYFLFKFGNDSAKPFQTARENFIMSMAAYSLACYLLAIKDRHNGNIMIDDAGHIIHIDFGFILDISPGNINVESSPFKLTSEMLQVMGSKEESPYFRWFRELCIQAFLVCRPYADLIIQLVEAMSESGLPCFKGESTIRKLRGRFRLDLSEAEARQCMTDLVYKSCENVRTIIYDRFQLETNGIPY